MAETHTGGRTPVRVDLPDGWRDQLAARLAAREARRARRAAERAALAEARQHGLARRHARKLAGRDA